MTEYYINPMWFYWLNIADGLKTVVICFAAAFGIAAFVGFMIDDEDVMSKSMHRLFVIGTFVFIFAAVLIPSKETLIEMQIARLATKSNLEWSDDAIKSMVDYIIEAVKSMK